MNLLYYQLRRAIRKVSSVYKKTKNQFFVVSYRASFAKGLTVFSIKRVSSDLKRSKAKQRKKKISFAWRTCYRFWHFDVYRRKNEVKICYIEHFDKNEITSSQSETVIQFLCILSGAFFHLYGLIWLKGKTKTEQNVE